MVHVNEQVGGAVTIGCRISGEVAAELSRRAKAAERTVSGELRLAISEHLRRTDA